MAFRIFGALVLLVLPAARIEVNSAPMHEAITRTVEDSESFGPFSIDVNTRHGLIEVTGAAAGEKENKFLRQAALRLQGADRVKNRTKTSPEPSEDATAQLARYIFAVKREKDLGGLDTLTRDALTAARAARKHHQDTNEVTSLVSAVDAVGNIRREIAEMRRICPYITVLLKFRRVVFLKA